MRIQKINENKVIKYYKDKKKRKRLEYEIEILEKSNNELEEYINRFENKNHIEVRLEENRKKLLEKKLKLNEFIYESIGLEAFILALNKDDKELCELRYDKELGYQEIGRILHISSSTISRRLNNILMTVNT